MSVLEGISGMIPPKAGSLQVPRILLVRFHKKMKTRSMGSFYVRLARGKESFPLRGRIELTYRCCLNCIHCYCKGLNSDKEERNKELTTFEVKRIFDEIQKEGCLFLTLTGGDPLVRDDFLEIYSYAKEKGFLITLFTTGQTFTDKIINFLVKSPPVSIEITLNGITKETYESITQTRGSYLKVMKTIRLLKEKKLPLKLKTNCLKQNKHELGRIKAFSEELLGRPSKRAFYFKYDPMIYPRLDGNLSPTKHRLSFKALQELRKRDVDIWLEYQNSMHRGLPDFKTDRKLLYRCDAWMNSFFINPYGRLKFCQFSEKFNVDLRKQAFRKGFYEMFPKISGEQFRTDSKCRDCYLRAVCYYCPARAYIETGNEEAPVPYYCELAEERAKQIKVATQLK